MDRRAIALFASTFLAISTTIPARAREAEGVVAEIDRAGALLVLQDGTRYVLPESFDYAPIQPGMQVHMIYLG